MFTLVKEFNQADIISSLKNNLDKDSERARFMTRAMPGKITLADLKKWWKKNDEGWPLSICICVAEGAEMHLLTKESVSNEDCIDAFTHVMSNVPDPRRPTLEPALWVQYVMNRIKLHGPGRNVASKVHIWAEEDCALVVTNPHLFPDGGHFIFDPLSGLYRTNRAILEEMEKIEDPVAKMEKLVRAFAGKDLKPYASGWGAVSVLKTFIAYARKGSPFPSSLIKRPEGEEDEFPITY